MARDQQQFVDVVNRDTAERRLWVAHRPEVLESEEVNYSAALPRVLAVAADVEVRA